MFFCLCYLTLISVHKLLICIATRFSSTSFRSRSSHQRCTVRKGVLRNFSKFTGNHLCQSLFLNKIAGIPQKWDTKVGPGTQGDTLRWDPRVGHLGGTLWCGETLKWDPKVKARRTVLIHIKEIVLYLVYQVAFCRL